MRVDNALRRFPIGALAEITVRNFNDGSDPSKVQIVKQAKLETALPVEN
jgi:hypothetical protein